LLYLSPVNILAAKGGQEEFERRKQVLRALASTGTEVDLWENETGPVAIETEEDERAAIPGLLVNIKKAGGYDAIMLGCFGDPALYDLRGLIDRPVLGPGIASMHAACLVADRFSVLSPVKTTVESTRKQAFVYGLGLRLASVRSVDVPVLTIRQDRSRAASAAVEIARACVEQDGAGVLVLGCMSMAFQRLDRDISQQVGKPVINPLIPLVRFAETLALCQGA
jgi:allantoin racemase